MDEVNPERRKRAETSAEDDLNKSHKQILTDVHEELINPFRPPEKNLAHANKLIASIMVRTAISNDSASNELIKLTKKISNLTVTLVTLTGVLVLLTVVLAVVSFK